MTRPLVMASPISTLPSLCSNSTSIKSAFYSPRSSSISYQKSPKLGLSTWIPQLGLSPFPRWTGLKPLGIVPKFSKSEKKGRRKSMVVQASLFGVGAPEALVIGAVALLVFGPKGLAEVARNLGKTLRAFQPTIRELQDVSREFKNTLEREIGLDDISSQTQNSYTPNRTDTAPISSSTGGTENSTTAADPVVDSASPPTTRAYTSEEYLKLTEEQLKAAASQHQGQASQSGENQLEPQTAPQGTDGAMRPLEKPEDEKS